MSISLLVVSLSLALQLLAAFVALRLIVTREKRAAGVMMLFATFLMAFRRTISLYRSIEGGEIKTDLFAETVGCMISFLLLIGFLYISNLLKSLRILRGLLPVCASCKKIRNDEGYWQQMEAYIRDHSDAEFTHGLCPECGEKSTRRIKRAQIGAGITPKSAQVKMIIKQADTIREYIRRRDYFLPVRMNTGFFRQGSISNPAAFAHPVFRIFSADVQET